jgi:putative glutamine amidotransferase
MKKRKIAITDDVGLDQELIAKLFKLHQIEPVVIPTDLRAFQAKTLEKAGPSIEAAHLEQVKQLMANCDGLLLPGNKYDIDPAHYREPKVHPETKKKLHSDPFYLRFEVEKQMLLSAISQKLPIVAICGGMQVANVVFGGSLTQHLPDVSQAVTHRADHQIEDAVVDQWKEDFERHVLTGVPRNIYGEHPHPIRVVKESKLGDLYEKYNPSVDLDNVFELSIHHQGIFAENLAPNLQAVATSQDGVVEAVELLGYPSLFIATQYHFEYNVSNMASGIVRELVS